jgi:purine-cytosine permease-like protein
VLAGIFLVAAVVFGTQLLNTVGPAAARSMNWLSAVFAVTLFADVLVILPMWLLVRLLERARGKQVVFK